MPEIQTHFKVLFFIGLQEIQKNDLMQGSTRWSTAKTG